MILRHIMVFKTLQKDKKPQIILNVNIGIGSLDVRYDGDPISIE